MCVRLQVWVNLDRTFPPLPVSPTIPPVASFTTFASIIMLNWLRPTPGPQHNSVHHPHPPRPPLHGERPNALYNDVETCCLIRVLAAALRICENGWEPTPLRSSVRVPVSLVQRLRWGWVRRPHMNQCGNMSWAKDNLQRDWKAFHKHLYSRLLHYSSYSKKKKPVFHRGQMKTKWVNYNRRKVTKSHNEDVRYYYCYYFYYYYYSLLLLLSLLFISLKLFAVAPIHLHLCFWEPSKHCNSLIIELICKLFALSLPLWFPLTIYENILQVPDFC